MVEAFLPFSYKDFFVMILRMEVSNSSDVQADSDVQLLVFRQTC